MKNNVTFFVRETTNIIIIISLLFLYFYGSLTTHFACIYLSILKYFDDGDKRIDNPHVL